MISDYNYVHKVKIKPNKNQRETIDFWLRKCKTLYNVALEEKITYYKITNKYLNVYEQKKELVDIKDFDNSWKDVPNKVLQEIIFRVDKSYKNFFNGCGFPKFQKNINSLEFVKTDVRMIDGEIYIPKIKESIKCLENVKEGWTSVKLTKKNNDFHFVFSYVDCKEIDTDNTDILGIDLGLMSLYTDSNGDKVKRFSKKLITKYHKRIEELNKSLSKKKKGSRKFKKVKKHLSKTYERLTSTKNDYLHKESLKLVQKKESVISLGDIKINSIIKNKMSKKGLIKSFYVNSLGIFKQYVSYKSTKHNKICILVDERMTSRTCSCCGNKKHDLKLSDRVFYCLVCKNSIDRDQNSAINMKLLGSSSLLYNKLVSSKKEIINIV